MQPHDGIEMSTLTWSPNRRATVAIAAIILFVITEIVLRPMAIEQCSARAGYGILQCFSIRLYAPRIILPFLFVMAIFGLRPSLSILGIDRPVAPGLILAISATSFMGIGLAFSHQPSEASDLVPVLLRRALVSGLTEEVLYRGFLFGILFRVARISFIPAAIASAALFGAMHVAQGADLIESVIIFAVTSIGGSWFAWLFVAWGNNIWVPASLHVSMNGLWELFEVSNTAAGSFLTDLLRASVIVVSIMLTWLYTKHRGVAERTGSLKA